MKRNIIHTLWAAALLLTACTQEELPLPGADNAAPLAITVTDGGYAPTASPGDMQKATATRATENGYRTDFTAGDQCGLYIVRGGAVVYDNVKLTAAEGTEGGLVWQPDAGVTLAGGLSGESYFLYYPYRENMKDKVTASATSNEEFFAPLISGWQPEADQSDYANYTNSDLMTAKGTASKADGKLSLSFAVTHRMALAVIEMPKTVYKFTDAGIPDYTILTAADFTAEARPYRNSDGTYRYIVKPAAQPVSLTGSYDNGKKEFTVTPSGITASSYKTYKVDGAKTDEKSHDLQPGDYLLADGNIIGKNETLTAGQQAACIAIVFHAGHHANDGSDYSATGIGSEKCHGYAVALQDATSSRYCMWGVYGTELGCCPTDGSGNKQNNFSTPDIDWSGYAWTQKIITAAGGKEQLNATDQFGYPATYYAVVDYENNKAQAPANSSGWFLPSIGQMRNVYQNRTSLFDGKTGVSALQRDWYWSSSEYYNNPARSALYVAVDGGGLLGYYRKNNSVSSYVRPVLAF